MAFNETKQQHEHTSSFEEYIHRIADASERIHTPILTHDEIDAHSQTIHLHEILDDEILQQQVRQPRKSKKE